MDIKKTAGKSAPARIKTIDILRGFSIIYMIIAHTSQSWLVPTQKYYFDFTFMGMEVVGANAFVLISGVSLLISHKKQMEKVARLPDYTKKHAFMNFFMRTMIILGMSFGLNYVGMLALGRPQVWIWLVLMTIGFGRLFCYPLLRFHPAVRAVIAAFIFLLTDPIREFLATTDPVMFYIMFNGLMDDTPFPFFGFMLFGTVIGDWIYGNYMNPSAGREKEGYGNYMNPSAGREKEGGVLHKIRSFMAHDCRFFIGLGAVIFIFGIFIGIHPNSSYNAIYMVYNVNRSGLYSVSSLPTFLTRSTTAWSFYTFGFQLMVWGFMLGRELGFGRKRIISDKNTGRSIGPVSKINAISHPNLMSNIPLKGEVRGLTVFGQMSLTVYISHYSIVFLFADMLTIFQYIPAVAVTILGFYYIMYLWKNRGKGKWSVEWMIAEITKMAVRSV